MGDCFVYGGNIHSDSWSKFGSQYKADGTRFDGKKEKCEKCGSEVWLCVQTEKRKEGSTYMTSRPGFNCQQCRHVKMIPGFVEYAIQRK